MVFFEVPNIVNSRPIGIVSGSDPTCPDPITPNHLLLGRSTTEVAVGPYGYPLLRAPLLHALHGYPLRPHPLNTLFWTISPDIHSPGRPPETPLLSIL